MGVEAFAGSKSDIVVGEIHPTARLKDHETTRDLQCLAGMQWMSGGITGSVNCLCEPSTFKIQKASNWAPRDAIFLNLPLSTTLLNYMATKCHPCSASRRVQRAVAGQDGGQVCLSIHKNEILVLPVCSVVKRMLAGHIVTGIVIGGHGHGFDSLHRFIDQDCLFSHTLSSFSVLLVQDHEIDDLGSVEANQYHEQCETMQMS